MSTRVANKILYQAALSDMACLPKDMILLATAIQRARTPAYSMKLAVAGGQPITDLIMDEINLWVVCGSAGTLEFALVRDGTAGPLTQLTVVAGQKVEGHFAQIGPNTTVFPLIGFGNLP